MGLGRGPCWATEQPSSLPLASEQLFMEMADRLAQDGWRDLGYVYLNLDDCWIGGRDAKGNLVPDRKRFPHGIAFLADYVSPPTAALSCPLACGPDHSFHPLLLRAHFYNPCLRTNSLVEV